MKSVQQYVYAAGYLLNIMATAVMNVLVARFLGAAAYGTLSLARAVYQTALLITPLGMDLGLQRFLGSKESSQRFSSRLFYLARRVGFWTSVGAFTLLALSGPVLTNLYEVPAFISVLLWTLLALPFATDIVLLGALARARGDLKWFINTTLIFQPLLRLVLTAGVVWFWPDVATVAQVSTVGIVFSWLFYRKLEPLPHAGNEIDDGEDAGPTRQFVEASLWLCATLFFYGCLRSADLLIVGIFVPADKVGQYAAMGFIAQMVQALAYAVAQGVGSRIAAAHSEKNHAKMREITREAMRRASPMSLFIFGGVAAFGVDLHVIFGPDFRVSAVVPAALALGYLAGGVLGMAGYSLSMTGRHKLESAIVVTGGCAMAAASAVGASLYGIEGAAMGSCLVLIGVNLARLVVVQRVLGFTLPEALLVGAGAPMFALALLARTVSHNVIGHPLMQLIGGSLLYGGFSLLMLVLAKRLLPHAARRLTSA